MVGGRQLAYAADNSMKKVSLEQLPREGVSHDPQITKQVLLRTGNVPHLTTFARATLLPGQIAREHSHRDMFEVFLVDVGMGVMKIGGVEHQLAAGVCIVVEPGETHEIVNDSATDLVLTYFGVAT